MTEEDERKKERKKEIIFAPSSIVARLMIWNDGVWSYSQEGGENQFSKKGKK